MSSFLVSLGKTFISIFGTPTEKADLAAYEAWQRVQATPQGQDFMACVSKAAMMNFGSAIAASPIAAQQAKAPSPPKVNDDLTGSEIAGPNAANRR